jgi:4-hydroxy-tetrahydrodipicolinate reductase
MKIAIVGYGKMGQLIESVAVARGFEIVARFDEWNNAGGAGINAESLCGADVAIEFSTPDAAPANLRRLIELGLPVVVGTTGWAEHLDEIKRLVEEHQGALVYGANFSIGMNLFFRLAREAARLFARYEEYDPFLIEQHHKFKKDAPSGTALVIARLMAESYGDRTPAAVSVRAGHIPGTHEIGFDAEADTVTLAHTARSRHGFASGAVLAAERLRGRRGCFEFSQLLFDEEER